MNRISYEEIEKEDQNIFVNSFSAF